MKSLNPTIIVVVLFALAHFAPIRAEAQVYSGPKCLGSACMDREMAIEGLAEQLGGPSSAGGAYGYRTNKGDAPLTSTASWSGLAS